ncbi:MAG: hypothetical protein ABJN40_12485 [Sneathiella sp.]
MYKNRKAAALMLMLSFLWTPFLTYLSAPAFAQNGHLNWVVICTYKGLQTMPLDQQGQPVDMAEEVCPVLQLFVSLSQIALPDTLHIDRIFVAASLTLHVGQPFGKSNNLLYSHQARAPPLVTL